MSLVDRRLQRARASSWEDVANWFLRLNGFLTTQNFVLHPADAATPGQLGELDVVGIRLPDRTERVMEAQLADHRLFLGATHVLLVLADATARRCKFTGAWSNAQKVGATLRAIGIPALDASAAANGLCVRRCFSNERLEARMLAFGKKFNRNLPPDAQLTWDEVLGFIFDRFNSYRLGKGDHPTWPEVGRMLWPTPSEARSSYIDRVTAACSNSDAAQSDAGSHGGPGRDPE